MEKWTSNNKIKWHKKFREVALGSNSTSPPLYICHWCHISREHHTLCSEYINWCPPMYPWLVSLKFISVFFNNNNSIIDSICFVMASNNCSRRWNPYSQALMWGSDYCSKGYCYFLKHPGKPQQFSIYANSTIHI